MANMLITHIDNGIEMGQLPRMIRQERARILCQLLPATYPNAHCELVYGTPFELLIATILSAQCTDKRVNMVTAKLFSALRSVRDFAEISQENLEAAIHSTGFYRNKAKNIRAAAQKILDLYGGEVPNTLEALASLPGVGRKTANVVLGNAFHRDEGVVVDTHVLRLSKRLGLTEHTNPIKVERDLMKLFPKKVWSDLSHWLIWHGRRRCTARKPDCLHCELQQICPSAFQVGGQSVVASRRASQGSGLA